MVSASAFMLLARVRLEFIGKGRTAELPGGPRKRKPNSTGARRLMRAPSSRSALRAVHPRKVRNGRPTVKGRRHPSAPISVLARAAIAVVFSRVVGGRRQQARLSDQPAGLLGRSFAIEEDRRSLH